MGKMVCRMRIFDPFLRPIGRKIFPKSATKTYTTLFTFSNRLFIEKKRDKNFLFVF